MHSAEMGACAVAQRTNFETEARSNELNIGFIQECRKKSLRCFDEALEPSFAQ